MSRRRAFLRGLKISIVILTLALLQINILPSIWFLKVRPDLLLVYAIVIGLNSARLPGLIISVLSCGLLKDIFGLRLFGFNSALFVLEATSIYFVSRYLYKEAVGLRFIFLISATLLNYLLLTVIFKRPYIIIGLQEALINCLFLPLLSKFYNFTYAHK